MVDDFAGHRMGTRTITLLPAPSTSTTAQATFTESGGVGILTAGGNGNTSSGVQLDYALSNVDLTDGGNNDQFLLEFVSIMRLPVSDPAQVAASVTIQVKDHSGVTGVYGTAVQNMSGGDAQNIVLNMNCSGGGTCFSPHPDFAHVDHITVSMMYPQNYDSTRSLTLKVEQIRTTPTGGATPPKPVVDITAPASPAYGISGATLTFPVQVTPGSSTTTINTPLSASGVTVSGTAAGTGNVAVTGSGTSYTVKVGPLTGSGTVKVDVKSDAVVDSWGQGNNASSATTTFAMVVPPAFTGAAPPAATVGTAYSHTFTAGTSGPTTYALDTGSLPAGLTLASNGTLSGTPTAGGSATFTVKATNLAGSATRQVTLDVQSPPTISGPSTVDGLVGAALDTTYTLGGLPTPDVEVSGLPAGIAATQDGDQLRLHGTPTASGSFTATITATSYTTVTKDVTFSIDTKPTFTSAPAATFTAGQAGSFTVETDGRPAATVSTSSPLPAGVTLTAQGGGTALLAGTPAAGTGGTYLLSLSAQSSAGTTPQAFVLTVQEAPAFTGTSTLTLTKGAPADVTVHANGYPAPTMTALDPLPAGLSANGTGGGDLVISGSPTATGTTTVRLQASNGVGLPVVVTYTVVVTQMPTVTSDATAQLTTGVPADLTITTEGYPTPSVTHLGTLPAGLTFVAGTDGTAHITGTPAAGSGGVYPVSITASSTAGTWYQTLTITVAQPPAVTSPAAASALTGEARTVTVTATGFPAPQITVTGELPPGMTTSSGTATATISGTPAAGTGGTYVLDVTATSTSGTVHQAFTLTVDQPPAITSADHTTALVGSAGSFTVETTGFPAPAIATASALPDGLALVDNHDGTATLSGTPTESGTFALTLSATNGVGQAASQSFALTVQEHAAFTNVDHATVTTGDQVSVPLTATGFPAPQISTTSTLPAGLALVLGPAGQATISGTPGAASGGTYTLELTAANGVGTAATQTFTLTVLQPAGLPPAASVDLSTAAPADLPIVATGYPSPAITSSSLPAGLTLDDHGDGTASITGTPTVSGVRTVTVTADNGVGQAATQALTLTIADAPVFTSDADVTVRTGETAALDVTASGFPLPVLSITSTLPDGLTFAPGQAGSATITGTPGATAGGTYPLDVVATSTSGTTHQTLTLTVDQAAVITSGADATVETHHPVSITLTSTGFPLPTLSTTSSLPEGLALAAAADGTATITGTPTEAGVFTLELRATNGVGQAASQSFVLTVQDAPAITSADEATVRTGDDVSIPITATGLPEPTLSTSSALPDGLALVTDQSGTSITGTPSADAGGRYAIELEATSPLGTAHQTFTLTVRQPVAFTSATTATVHVGTPAEVTITTSGYPAATLGTASDLPDGLTFTDNGDGTATISGTPAEGSGGTSTVELTASNPLGDATTSLTLTDLEDTRFTSTDEASFTVGSAGTFEVTTTGYPVAGLTGAGELPEGLVLHDAGDGTATISGTPRKGEAGTYSFTVTATAPAGGVLAVGHGAAVRRPGALAVAAAAIPAVSQTITVTVAPGADASTGPSTSPTETATPTPSSPAPSTSPSSSTTPSTGATDPGTPLASTGASLAPLLGGLLLLLAGTALVVLRRRLGRG